MKFLNKWVLKMAYKTVISKSQDRIEDLLSSLLVILLVSLETELTSLLILILAVAKASHQKKNLALGFERD